MINRIGRITGVVTTDEFISNRWLRIQLTRKFDELPGTLKSNERYRRSQTNNELWLKDLRKTINVQDIIRHTRVWIKDNDSHVPSISEFTIQEIVYTFNDHHKI